MMPTLNPSWRQKLKLALTPLQRADQSGRLALLGIGQELRGDDAAGLLVARELNERYHNLSNCMIVEAGPAPESFTGPLRRFNPTLVLLIDAARMDEPPGTVRWLEIDDIGGITSSTHTLPLSIIASYLSVELNCQVSLLGIQPTTLDFNLPLSQSVAEAVNEVVEEIAGLIA